MLNNPQNVAYNLTKPKSIGHWGNGDYWADIDKKNNFNYDVFNLIKQSYYLNKQK